MKLGEICMSCGACENICPVDAIKMDINEEGYYRPIIDKTVCTECNRCIGVCPQINPPSKENHSKPNCYALWADDEVRWNSSSGGAFTLFAEYILSKNGIVYGCVFAEEIRNRLLSQGIHDVIMITDFFHEMRY